MNNPTKYIINYCCHEDIDIKQIFPDKQQSSEILRQAAISIIHKTPRVSIDKK